MQTNSRAYAGDMGINKKEMSKGLLGLATLLWHTDRKALAAASEDSKQQHIYTTT